MSIIFKIVRISLIICVSFALTNPIETQTPKTSEDESQKINTVNEKSTPVEVTLRWSIKGDKITIETFVDQNNVKKAEENLSNPQYSLESEQKQAVIEVITGMDDTAIKALQREIEVTPDGKFGQGAWKAFVEYLAKTRERLNLKFGNRIIKLLPPKSILQTLQEDVTTLKKQIGNLNEQIQIVTSNEERLKKLEKDKLRITSFILSLMGAFAALFVIILLCYIFIAPLRRRLPQPVKKQLKSLLGFISREEALEEITKKQPIEQQVNDLKEEIEERSDAFSKELQYYQKKISEDLEANRKEIEPIRLFTTGLETFISAREEQYQKTQSPVIDLKELEAFQKDLSRFNGSLEKIEELLVSNRENFANAREQKVTSVLRKVEAIYEVQTQPPTDEIKKSLAEKWLDVIKREIGVQVDESFDSLRKQVNFKLLVQFFARHIDEEYQSEMRNEASIEAIFRALLQFVNLTEIRPRIGERYNPRHHYILREERRLDVPQGAISRTYLRGFMENGEVISKAQVIIGR